MKLVVSMVVFMTSISAIAFPLPKEALKKVLVSKAIKQKVIPQCVDLSGNWKGTCQFGAESPYADEMKIVQYNCNDVSVSGVNASPGSVQTRVETIQYGSVPFINSTVMDASWNASGTTLYLNGVMFARGLNGDLTQTAQAQSMPFTAQFSRNGNNLYLNEDFLGSTLRCVYTAP